MKKVFYIALLFVVCFLFLDNRRQLSVVSAQNSPLSRIATGNDRAIADKVRQLTNRSTDDLPEQMTTNGEASIDLEDRLQNVMLSRIDTDGEPVAACVTSVDEANAFFGKDLETGALVSSAQYRPEKKAQAAAGYGMSQQEFEFYKNLIAQAETRRANSATSGATIKIVNADGAGEGFNDPAAKAPEGNNTGVTLGEQRLNLFNFAAAIWGAYLDTSVTINVNSQFNPLTCSASSAVLGSAGATSIYRDFPNAPLVNTWYPVALASKLSGTDINGATPEINATFNSSMDLGSCIGGRTFYYGLDNSSPTGRVNLLVVLLHEMGHGLGFAGAVNGTTGQLAGDATYGRFPDVFSRNIFDRTTGKYWYQMTDAERVASSINNGNVLWDGASVRMASGLQTIGRDAANGRIQLFMPAAFQGGSSISHFDTAAFPNLLMEPNITSGLPLNLDLTRQQMRDIGWYRDTTGDLIPDTITDIKPSGGALTAGSTAAISWTNNGSFDRNVTVEISVDGGANFTVLASNIPNSGSYNFTVPNTATGQAQVRVREYDFFEPAGVSATNFSIGAPSAVKRTKYDYDGDGKADVSVWRPSTGMWYLLGSNSPFTGYQFGLSIDRLTPADYDGDGKTDLAVYRNGDWFLQRSSTGFFAFNFGLPTDIPTPADFDGDGKAELAVYRPSNGMWYIWNLVNNNFSAMQFGLPEDKPVAADYDGDGKDDIAVYRPSSGMWYMQKSRDGFAGTQFGIATDKPIVGDYDGDGRADQAVYRLENGIWYLNLSRDGFTAFQFGISTDLPAPADFDGDGRTDLAVYRIATGMWYYQKSTLGFGGVQFGISEDKPTSGAYVH